MLEKTKEKLQRKERLTWEGFFPRVTPTKKEKEERAQHKHKGRVSED